MFPYSSFHDVRDGSGATLKEQSQFSVSGVLAPVKASNLHDFRGLKFRLSVFLAFIASTLLNPVKCINFGSAKEKMKRIDAGRRVAFVKDVLTFRDRSDMQNPRSAMCANGVNLVRGASDMSIPPALKKCAGPDPARSQLGTVRWHLSVSIHFRPKAFWEGFRKSLAGEVLRGNFFHLLVLRPFGLLAQRAHSFSQLPVWSQYLCLTP